MASDGADTLNPLWPVGPYQRGKTLTATHRPYPSRHKGRLHGIALRPLPHLSRDDSPTRPQPPRMARKTVATSAATTPSVLRDSHQPSPKTTQVGPPNSPPSPLLQVRNSGRPIPNHMMESTRRCRPLPDSPVPPAHTFAPSPRQRTLKSALWPVPHPATRHPRILASTPRILTRPSPHGPLASIHHTGSDFALTIRPPVPLSTQRPPRISPAPPRPPRVLPSVRLPDSSPDRPLPVPPRPSSPLATASRPQGPPSIASWPDPHCATHRASPSRLGPGFTDVSLSAPTLSCTSTGSRKQQAKRQAWDFSPNPTSLRDSTPRPRLSPTALPSSPLQFDVSSLPFLFGPGSDFETASGTAPGKIAHADFGRTQVATPARCHHSIVSHTRMHLSASPIYDGSLAKAVATAKAMNRAATRMLKPAAQPKVP